MVTGLGAWQNWSYDVHMDNDDTGGTVYIGAEMFSSQVTVSSLRSNTTYSIRVQPASIAGRAADSHFIGRTLANVKPAMKVFWATSDAITESTGFDVYVDTLVRLTDFSADKSGGGVVHVVSMAWLDNYIYVVTNQSRVYVVDVASKNVSLMKNVDAVSVAVDFLAKRLYWSSATARLETVSLYLISILDFVKKMIYLNAVNLQIGRTLYDGSQSEWLPINTVAKHLAVDSLRGKLIWCTSHSVQASSLNAEDPYTYWKTGMFPGPQRESSSQPCYILHYYYYYFLHKTRTRTTFRITTKIVFVSNI